MYFCFKSLQNRSWSCLTIKKIEKYLVFNYDYYKWYQKDVLKWCWGCFFPPKYACNRWKPIEQRWSLAIVARSHSGPFGGDCLQEGRGGGFTHLPPSCWCPVIPEPFITARWKLDMHCRPPPHPKASAFHSSPCGSVLLIAVRGAAMDPQTHPTTLMCASGKLVLIAKLKSTFKQV